MEAKSRNKTGTQRKNQRGYTLLEYCAGAALLLAVVWGGMNALGTEMSGYLGRIGDWLRNTQFDNPPTP